MKTPQEESTSKEQPDGWESVLGKEYVEQHTEGVKPESPIPIKAGDKRVLVNGRTIPVDFRIVAEDKWKALQAQVDSLQKENKRLEDDYNKLGVKFDKELERWQERDVEQRNRIQSLTNQ